MAVSTSGNRRLPRSRLCVCAPMLLGLITLGTLLVMAGSVPAGASSLCLTSGRSELPVCPGGPRYVGVTSQNAPAMLVSADGSVTESSGAKGDGTSGLNLNAPIVEITYSLPGGPGYWLVAA